MILNQIHASIAQTIPLFFLICAAWAFMTYFRRQTLTGSFWGTAFVGVLLYVAQMLIGIGLLVSGRAPANIVHFLYGIVGVLVLPAAYGYLPRLGDRAPLIIGVICLFLFGIALRATGTGRV